MSDEKQFYPDWMNMNLSEMVEKSMALKVIPIIQFLDKDKTTTGFVPSKPLDERTPIDVLNGEIRMLRRCLRDLSDILKNTSDKQKAEKVKQVRIRLRKQVQLFKEAIKKLKTNEQ